MKVQCPRCFIAKVRPVGNFIRCGFFKRKSDSKIIRRFRCLECSKTFSNATWNKCFRQRKRHLNSWVRNLLVSNVSQRRTARILGINRKTVVRKFHFLAEHARETLKQTNLTFPESIEVEFDDLETAEHTKCKPISLTMAVESYSRRILGFEVSPMPAKGKLASLSRKRYGVRPDERPLARAKLFREIFPLIAIGAIIKTDESPHYPKDIRNFFSHCRHQTFKGKMATVAGQGELKKVGHDPIFSINHTFAMLRANINRLIRRTWCTTKKYQNLSDHIAIYSVYHNQVLLQING